jgi:hypothetical protein
MIFSLAFGVMLGSGIGLCTPQPSGRAALVPASKPADLGSVWPASGWLRLGGPLARTLLPPWFAEHLVIWNRHAVVVVGFAELLAFDPAFRPAGSAPVQNRKSLKKARLPPLRPPKTAVYLIMAVLLS